MVSCRSCVNSLIKPVGVPRKVGSVQIHTEKGYYNNLASVAQLVTVKMLFFLVFASLVAVMGSNSGILLTFQRCSTDTTYLLHALLILLSKRSVVLHLYNLRELSLQCTVVLLRSCRLETSPLCASIASLETRALNVHYTR